MRIFFLAILLLQTRLGYTQSSPTAIVQSKTVAVAPFMNLKLFSGIDSVLIPADENKVVIKCDDPESVVITQKNNTLRIRVSLSKLIALPVVYVEIYYKDLLDEIDLNQGSSMKIDSTLKQTSIVLKIQEGAQLSGTFDVVKLTTNVGTGAQAELKGKAKNHKLTVNSGGTCEAEQLITEQTAVRVTAGGVAYANATALMEAQVNFNGTIRVYGNPTKLTTQKTLGGQIIEMN